MMEGNALRRGLELVAGAGASALLTIAAMVYLGRLLGPAEYADFSAALAIIYFVSLALSPVVPTVARSVARNAANGNMTAIAALRASMWRIAASSSAAVLLIAVIASGPLTDWLRFRATTPLILAVASGLVFIVLSIDRGFLQGLFRFRAYNANTIAEAVVRAGLVFAVSSRIPTAGFAIGTWFAGAITAQALAAFALRSYTRGGDNAAADWRDFTSLLRPMIVLMASLAVFQNTDVLAVKRWMTPEVAGSYGAASALARGFGALFVPLYSLAGPLLTRAHELHGDVRRDTLRLSFGYLGLAALPLIGIVFWGRPVVIALYGAEFATASAVLPLLSAITVLTYFALMLTQGLITVGDYRFVGAYAIGAAVQIAGLAFAHASLRDVLLVLCVAQGVTISLVIIIFLNSQKVMRAGTNSSAM